MNVPKPKRCQFFKNCVLYYVFFSLFFLILMHVQAYRYWIDFFQGKEGWTADDAIAYALVLLVVIPQGFAFLFFPIALIARLFNKLQVLYKMRVILILSFLMALVTLWINPAWQLERFIYFIDSFSVGQPIDDQPQRDLIQAGVSQDDRKTNGRMES